KAGGSPPPAGAGRRIKTASTSIRADGSLRPIWPETGPALPMTTARKPDKRRESGGGFVVRRALRGMAHPTGGRGGRIDHARSGNCGGVARRPVLVMAEKVLNAK